MLTTDDLQSLKAIVKDAVEPIKKQLDAVEMKVGTIETNLKSIELKVELVNKKIEQSQQDTIDVLSELIHTGYGLHDERIKKIEEHLKTSHIH
jgi:hypothetical protein